MKSLMTRRFDPLTPSRRRMFALALSSALWASALTVTPASAQPTTRLSEDQRILHVLNRLGFGARPGDVERVRKMGINRYIDAQLHPERIEDSATEAKLADLPSLQMTTAELYAKYPQPGQLIKQMQRRGDLPADLAAARDTRKGGDAKPATSDNASKPNKTAMNAMPNDQAAKDANTTAVDAGKNDNKKEYRELIKNYYKENNLQLPQRITAELQASRIVRAVESDRQLQEKMVDFWTNHFNVFAGKGADRWMLVSYDRDTIRPHTLGKFEDLLIATAQSPAMLFYLDNFQSVSPNAPQGGNRLGQQRRQELMNDPRFNRGGFGGGIFARTPQRAPLPSHNRTQPPPSASTPPSPALQKQQQRAKRGINENYARELMELHTLGVDGGYTQKDVQEVARCFTGWTILDPRGYAGKAGLVDPGKAGTFYFNPRLHDDGEKIVLGHKIPAGGGANDGLMVLDILAHHPSTAKFIVTKLCRHFVMDDPTPALVDRVAAAFTKSDGDIRETLRALFTSPEFNAPETYRDKIKTPFELAISSIRALGGDTDGGPALHNWIEKMGQPLYGYQTPNGYPDVAEAWVNTGALLERLNFALALVGNRIRGTRVDLARIVGDAAANGGQRLEQARIVDQFVNAILQGDVSSKTKATLFKQLNEAATAATPAGPPPTASSDEAKTEATVRNVRAARREQLAQGATVANPEVVRIAALVIGSPEFQRQ